MKVIAKKGTKCPKENNPRDYISDSEPVDVPESAYYKRLVDDGSLEIVTSQENASVIASEARQSKKGGR